MQSGKISSSNRSRHFLYPESIQSFFAILRAALIYPSGLLESNNRTYGTYGGRAAEEHEPAFGAHALEFPNVVFDDLQRLGLVVPKDEITFKRPP